MPIGVKEAEFTHFEDGEYKVKFEEWFPLDEEGLPRLVTQERFGEDILVIRFRTEIDGQEGPPGTIDPEHELLPLVRAFGGDPTKLKDEKDIGKKLLKAQKLMVGETKVSVSNGWISNSSIEGIGIPNGFYYLRLVGVTTKNELGEVGPIEGKGKAGPYFLGRVKISRGEYRDFEATFLLSYVFIPVEGGVALPLLSNGTLTLNAKRTKNYLEAFYGRDYADFPTDQCEDIGNVLPLLTKLMLERNLEAMGKIENNRLDLNSLGPIPEEEKQLLSKELTKETSSQSLPNILRQVITKEVQLHKQAPAFSDEKNWILTPEGSAWAKEQLVGIVDYPPALSHVFSDWGDNDIVRVLAGLGYNPNGTKKPTKVEQF